jgi:hypothetical protein
VDYTGVVDTGVKVVVIMVVVVMVSAVVVVSAIAEGHALREHMYAVWRDNRQIPIYRDKNSEQNGTTAAESVEGS